MRSDRGGGNAANATVANNVPIHVRNSQSDAEGTWIVAETPNMEHIVVSGAALKKDLIRVTLKQVPDKPGVAALIFSDIAAANIVVDDIIQNVTDDNTANISFTVEHGDLHDTVERATCGFEDRLHVLKALSSLCFEGGWNLSVRLTRSLSGDVQKLAGKNAGAIRANRLCAWRKNDALFEAGRE